MTGIRQPVVRPGPLDPIGEKEMGNVLPEESAPASELNPQSCSVCNGNGFFYTTENVPWPLPAKYNKCTACDGTGKIALEQRVAALETEVAKLRMIIETIAEHLDPQGNIAALRAALVDP